MKPQKSVLLGLSGGVDSAVAALLLKQKGYKVIGAFMKNFSETKNEITGDCNYLEDKKDAQKIAAILEIPFVSLDFEKEYKKYVIDPMFRDYAKGLTPNPDSLCNKIIKFPLLWREAKKLKCDYIATGHYIKRSYNKKTKSYEISIPKDKSKDQSYFLYELTQKDLEHTLFPIDGLTKTEVRVIAKKNKLPNADKLGTRGICFVGKIDMKDFLKQKIKPKPGKILDQDGNVIGKHNGIMYYTIGERIRENSNTQILKEHRNKLNKKMYVASKNKRANILVVVPQRHSLLRKNEFNLTKVHFINSKNKSLKVLKGVKVRIRHLAPLISAKIVKQNGKYKVKLSKSVQAVADGQSCVVYKGKKILGGGEIRF